MIIKEHNLVSEDGKEFNMEIYLNTCSIRQVEKELHQIDKNLNFYTGIPLIMKGELSVALIYICSCMHSPNDFRVKDSLFFDKNNINFFKYSNELIGSIIECLNDMQPTKENKLGK